MTDYVVGTGNNGTLTLRVTQSSQDIASNGSWDHWELWLSSSYRNTYQNSAKACQVQINGNVYNGTFTFNFNNYTDLLIMSGDTWVPHNADGTKSTAVYGYIASTGTSSIGGPASVSGTFYQSTIPRASTATLSANPVDAGTSVTIYTNRASTSFTHTIEYYFGSASGTIGTAQAVADSVVWATPTSLMDQIPNSTSGVGTIRCHTYSGATYIGYKDTSITINVPSSVVPTIGGITITEATAGLAANVGAFVQSLSKFTLTMTGVSYPYSATQVSAKLTVNGQTINSTSGTTPSVISVPGTVPVVATVTDSRGRVGTKTVNATVLAYAPPTITTVTTQRALSTGTPDDNGTYILTSLNASVQSLIVNSTQKNAINYRISTRLHGTSTWTANTAVVPGGVTFNGTKSYGTFPINSSYDVLVEVFDDFVTTAQQLSVPTSTIFMHWDSTIGVGIGKYREQGTLDVSGQIYQNDGEAIASRIELDTRAEWHEFNPSATGTPVYMRLAGITSASGTSGSHIHMVISGLGDYGTGDRGSATVIMSQRGDNKINVRLETDYGTSNKPLTLFTKQIGTYSFELWGMFAPWTMAHGLLVLASAYATVYLDSSTTAKPSGLVQVFQQDARTALLDTLGVAKPYNWLRGDFQWGLPSVTVSNGFAHMQGLITLESVPPGGTTICVLPEWARPDYDMVFLSDDSGASARSVYVKANGSVNLPANYSANGYLTLDNIVFPVVGKAQWTTIPTAWFVNGWRDFQTATGQTQYGPARYWKDEYGLVWMGGLAYPGTLTNGTAIIQFPAGHEAVGFGSGQHLATTSSDVMGFLYAPVSNTNSSPVVNALRHGASGSAWDSLCVTWNTPASAAATTWHTGDSNPLGTGADMALLQNWVNYDTSGATWPIFAVTQRPDGLCLTRGLIASGLVGNGGAFAYVPSSMTQNYSLLFTSVANQSLARFDLRGRVSPDPTSGLSIQGGSNAWFSMDGKKWIPSNTEQWK